MLYNKFMKKKPRYDKLNALLKGFATLSILTYLVSFILFVCFNAINFVPSLQHYIDFSELETLVNLIFLEVDAFLLIGLGISLIGLILVSTLTKSLAREKGGLKALFLILTSVALIVLFTVLKLKPMTLSYLLNYALGGILLVGIVGTLFGLIASFIRIRDKRKLEKQLRKYQKNYLKFQKYNR